MSPGRKRASRFVHALLAVFRVLAVMGAFQLSGAAPLVAELVADPSCESDCCSDCPFDEDGHECPPGCPSCHCAHGVTALPPAFESAPTWMTLPSDAALPAPYEAAVPRAPPASGIYRPPRTLTASA